MATLREKRKNGYVISVQEFYLNMSIQTGTVNKPEANRMLTKIQSRIDQLKIDREHEFHEWNKTDRRAYIKTGVAPTDKTDVTIAKAKDDYVKHLITLKKSHNYIKQTKDTYLARFEKHFGSDFIITDLRLNLLRDYMKKYAVTKIKRGKSLGENPSVKSQKKYLSEIERFYKWALKHYSLEDHSSLLAYFIFVDFIPRDEHWSDHLTKWVNFDERTDELTRLGYPKDNAKSYQEVVYSKKGINDLISTMKSKLWNCNENDVDRLKKRQLFVALLVCITTGCRRSELTRIRRNDLKEGTLVLHRKKGRGKRRWNRHTTIINGIVERYLDELLNDLPENKVSVFARCDRHINKIDFDEALDNSQAEVLSKEYEKALKGTKWQYAPHFHKFRHTLASQMIEDGKTKEEVQAYVGWADDAMVERYSHANHELKVKTIRDTLSYIQF